MLMGPTSSVLSSAPSEQPAEPGAEEGSRPHTPAGLGASRLADLPQRSFGGPASPPALPPRQHSLKLDPEVVDECESEGSKVLTEGSPKIALSPVSAALRASPECHKPNELPLVPFDSEGPVETAGPAAPALWVGLQPLAEEAPGKSHRVSALQWQGEELITVEEDEVLEEGLHSTKRFSSSRPRPISYSELIATPLSVTSAQMRRDRLNRLPTPRGRKARCKAYWKWALHEAVHFTADWFGARRFAEDSGQAAEVAEEIKAMWDPDDGLFSTESRTVFAQQFTRYHRSGTLMTLPSAGGRMSPKSPQAPAGPVSRVTPKKMLRLRPLERTPKAAAAAAPAAAAESPAPVVEEPVAPRLTTSTVETHSDARENFDVRLVIHEAESVSRKAALAFGPLKDTDQDVDFVESVRRILESQVTGSVQEETLIWQHFPLFVVLWCAAAMILWLSTLSSVDGIGQRSGLDSIWPRMTDFAVHKDCKDLRPQLWRWLSYQFTHVGFQHVGFNVLVALLTGIPLEGFHGHFRLILIFNLGVLVGAGCSAVFDAHTSSLVGMSAGCYALFGMHVADLMMNWYQTRYRKVKVVLLLVIVIGEVAGVAVPSLGKSSGSSSVSWSCHIGGLFVGLTAGTLLGRCLKVKRHKRIMQIISAFLMLTLAIFISVWVAQWAPRTLWDPQPWCWARQAYDPTLFGDSTWHCLRCKDESCINAWSSKFRPGYLRVVDFNVCNKIGWSYTQF